MEIPFFPFFDAEVPSRLGKNEMNKSIIYKQVS
jgi:hypothetical protein